MLKGVLVLCLSVGWLIAGELSDTTKLEERCVELKRDVQKIRADEEQAEKACHALQSRLEAIQRKTAEELKSAKAEEGVPTEGKDKTKQEPTDSAVQGTATSTD